MTRVFLSRAINYYLLRGEWEMVSTRVYRTQCYGCMLWLDWWFYFLRKEKNHCRNCHFYELEERLNGP